METPNWLEQVYLLTMAHKIDNAVDIVFERLDELFRHEKFEDCDNILQIVDLYKLETNLIIAFLSITLRAADKLPSRGNFVNRARQRFLAMELEPDRISKLLRGLE